MMPSHVLADLLGIDVTAALQQQRRACGRRIADAWNTIWDLKPGINPRWFPSSGPYKLDSVRSNGAVVLVANDRWWATKPVTKRITVWPRGADIAGPPQERLSRCRRRGHRVVGGLTVPDDYQRTDTASAGIEQLIFSGQGAAGRASRAPRAGAVHAARH